MVNRNISDRRRANREARAQRKAAYLSKLPKDPWKRWLFRLQPRHLREYWFSRDGAIMALKITGVCFVAGFLLIIGLFAYFRKDLPPIHSLNSNNSGGTISYYDRTGKVLLFQDYNAFKRIPVQSTQITPYMKEATVAIEDKNFYHEGGFNVKGIIRAAVNNVTGGSIQGASTITEQLVKLNEGWTNNVTVVRKIKELILSVELTREYSKDDILTAYLNTAPYSGLDYGVQAAAQDYFHENASQLTLPQAAMLASIPKAPTAFSPYSSPTWNSSITPSENYFDKKALIARQQYDLDLMAQQGYITEAQATAAKKVNVLAEVHNMPTDHYSSLKYPYFVLSAKRELEKDFPAAVLKSGGWKVITTMNVNLQNLADNALSSNANRLHADGANDAAFAAEDNSTGQILAEIGGMDFNKQQVDFADVAPISPGSSIKPYTYSALINDNNNVGAGSMIEDRQQPLPGYPCTNRSLPSNGGNCLWDDTRHYYGNVTLRYALGSSLNVPAVKVFTSSDPNDTTTLSNSGLYGWRLPSIKNSIQTVDALMDNPNGYRCYSSAKLQAESRTVLTATQADETQCGSAAGIGNSAYTTLTSHVNGIASIARMGQAIPSTFILKVINSSGKVIKQFKQPKAKQVIRPDAAYIVTNMLDDPGASYLSGRCNATNCYGMKFHRYKGWDIAIKTGTNQDYDGLMMSYTRKYTAGVWIGNYNRNPYGGQPEYVTDPIMKEFMQGAINQLGNVKPDNWPQPSDIKVLPAYHSNVPFTSESAPPAKDLFPAWYVGNATSAVETIDKVSGMLATSCTPPDARETVGGSTSSSLNVDIYSGGAPNISTSSSSATSTTAQPTDNVHSCADQKPTINITAVTPALNGSPSGNGNSATNCANGCQVTVYVQQGTYPLTDPKYPQYPGTVTLLANGKPVASQQVSSTGDYTLQYTPASTSSSGSSNSSSSTNNVQLTATVTDSVLYSDTSTAWTVSTTQPSQTGTSSGGGGSTSGGGATGSSGSSN